MIVISKELEACGYAGDPADFGDLAVEAMHALCPFWTVDELLVHPREALKVCTLVRDRAMAKSRIPDHLILRCLLNRRKHEARED